MLRVIIFLSIFAVVAVVYGIVMTIKHNRLCDYYDVTMEACKSYRRLVCRSWDREEKMSDELKNRTTEALRYRGCYNWYRGKYEALYKIHYGEDPKD